MAYLKFEELRKKSDKELEIIYESNCGAKGTSIAEAEQSTNRYKIELILRERADTKARILAWVGIGIAILIALFKWNISKFNHNISHIKNTGVHMKLIDIVYYIGCLIGTLLGYWQGHKDGYRKGYEERKSEQ